MTAVQQSAAPHPAVRQRIDWIDTAKGLCMILVIVGHTLPYGNLMRNFIFSFHMPAFFFLTGYTARLLLAVSVYDKDRDKASLNSLRRCMDDFKTIRRNMEELYSRTRTIEQPAGYILPMGYRSRLGLNTPDSSWMFLFELELLAHLDKMLSLYEEPN